MRRLLGGAAMLMAATLLACSSGDSDGRPPTPDPTEQLEQLIATAGPPEAVLRAWVQDHLNQGFVARCEDADRPGDVGKQCAHLHSERNGMLAYELGPTFSEFSRLVILRHDDGVWTIIQEETHSGEITTVPWPLEVGASVVVVVDSQCLQVRAQPGLDAVPVDCLEDGAEVTISAGPADLDGLSWWRLEGLGWVAGNWLRYPAE